VQQPGLVLQAGEVLVPRRWLGVAVCAAVETSVAVARKSCSLFKAVQFVSGKEEKKKKVYLNPEGWVQRSFGTGSANPFRPLLSLWASAFPLKSRGSQEPESFGEPETCAGSCPLSKFCWREEGC